MSSLSSFTTALLSSDSHSAIFCLATDKILREQLAGLLVCFIHRFDSIQNQAEEPSFQAVAKLVPKLIDIVHKWIRVIRKGVRMEEVERKRLKTVNMTVEDWLRKCEFKAAFLCLFEALEVGKMEKEMIVEICGELLSELLKVEKDFLPACGLLDLLTVIYSMRLKSLYERAVDAHLLILSVPFDFQILASSFEDFLNLPQLALLKYISILILGNRSNFNEGIDFLKASFQLILAQIARTHDATCGYLIELLHCSLTFLWQFVSVEILKKKRVEVNCDFSVDVALSSNLDSSTFAKLDIGFLESHRDAPVSALGAHHIKALTPVLYSLIESEVPPYVMQNIDLLNSWKKLQSIAFLFLTVFKPQSTSETVHAFAKMIKRMYGPGDALYMIWKSFQGNEQAQKVLFYALHKQEDQRLSKIFQAHFFRVFEKNFAILSPESFSHDRDLSLTQIEALNFLSSSLSILSTHCLLLPLESASSSIEMQLIKQVILKVKLLLDCWRPCACFCLFSLLNACLSLLITQASALLKIDFQNLPVSGSSFPSLTFMSNYYIDLLPFASTDVIRALLPSDFSNQYLLRMKLISEISFDFLDCLVPFFASIFPDSISHDQFQLFCCSAGELSLFLNLIARFLTFSKYEDQSILRTIPNEKIVEMFSKGSVLGNHWQQQALISLINIDCNGNNVIMSGAKHIYPCSLPICHIVRYLCGVVRRSFAAHFCCDSLDDLFLKESTRFKALNILELFCDKCLTLADPQLQSPLYQRLSRQFKMLSAQIFKHVYEVKSDSLNDIGCSAVCLFQTGAMIIANYSFCICNSKSPLETSNVNNAMGSAMCLFAYSFSNCCNTECVPAVKLVESILLFLFKNYRSLQYLHNMLHALTILRKFFVLAYPVEEGVEELRKTTNQDSLVTMAHCALHLRCICNCCITPKNWFCILLQKFKFWEVASFLLHYLPSETLSTHFVEEEAEEDSRPEWEIEAEDEDSPESDFYEITGQKKPIKMMIDSDEDEDEMNVSSTQEEFGDENGEDHEVLSGDEQNHSDLDEPESEAADFTSLGSSDETLGEQLLIDLQEESALCLMLSCEFTKICLPDLIDFSRRITLHGPKKSRKLTMSTVSTNSCHWDRLQLDLIKLILGFLDGQSQLTIASTCRINLRSVSEILFDPRAILKLAVTNSAKFANARLASINSLTPPSLEIQSKYVCLSFPLLDFLLTFEKYSDLEQERDALLSVRKFLDFYPPESQSFMYRKDGLIGIHKTPENKRITIVDIDGDEED